MTVAGRGRPALSERSEPKGGRPALSERSEPKGGRPQLPLLHVPGLFPSWIRWGFTTRRGGVSTGPFASLNIAGNVGDDRRCVRENRRRLAAALGFDPETLASVRQVHGRRVWVARTAAQARALRPERGDGIVLAPRAGTGRRPAPLAALVRVADCCPVIVVARRRRAAAVLHCGWRSLVQGLIAAGVETIARELRDPRPALAAAVGPCIGPAAFEVGEEVAERFAAIVGPEVVLRRRGWRRPHVDLQEAARRLLVRAGVPTERVVVFRRCTVGEPRAFFSFRRDGERSGRQAGVVCVRPGRVAARP